MTIQILVKKTLIVFAFTGLEISLLVQVALVKPVGSDICKPHILGAPITVAAVAQLAL